MIITLLAQKRNEENDIPPTVNGEIITYRGTNYDLSAIPDGGEVKAEEPAFGTIKRINGKIHISLWYFYDSTGELEQSRNIEDYTFDITNGQCPDPIKRVPVKEQFDHSDLESVVNVLEGGDNNV